MNRKANLMKGGIARGLIGVLLMQLASSPSQAAPKTIPIDIDLTNVLVIKQAEMDSNLTTLVNWRSGPITTSVANVTFQHLTGTNRPYPTRSTVLDHTANDLGDLWSDNAIQFVGVNPNTVGPGVQMVLIYTDNKDQFQITSNPLDKDDPLYSIVLRGGVVGGFGGAAKNPFRVSVLSLLWKAVPLQDLIDAQGVNTSGSKVVVSTSPVFMASQITTPSGGSCPTGASEGPYSAGGSRSSAGFCDFSTHYLIDVNNNFHLNRDGSGIIRDNSWYSEYASDPLRRQNAFDYATMVGAFGANTTDNGKGTLQLEPLTPAQLAVTTVTNRQNAGRAYFILGLSARTALRTHYFTTINIDLLSI